MSQYKYSMENYHAIESANIRIDGITVVCGENGTGKSTLSRWLYYLVNGTACFNFFLYENFISSLQRELSLLGTVYEDIRSGRSGLSSAMIYDGQRRLNELSERECEENVRQALAVYLNIVEKFVKVLSEYLSANHSKASKERVMNYLGITLSSQKALHQRIKDFIFEQRHKGEEIYQLYKEQREQRDLSKFFSLLKRHYDIREESPAGRVELMEDKVALFKNQKVGYLYNLKRAIYVDTPMAVSEDLAVDNLFWENLQTLMIYPRKGHEKTKGEMKLILRLQKLIKGNVMAEKDDFDRLELRYKREDGLDIKLDDVATGMKSFSYLLRLIENGFLDEQTLLLIDEPEAHLHPQWVVEFAHILVLLNKELGVKVVIASHHPDMVAAIQAIAEKEEKSETTYFYLAIPSDVPFRYVYGELGNNVEEIFKSFNKAYQRIRQYGDSTGL